LEAVDQAPEYNVTTLSNGFTVLTESQVFPGAVHMGKLYIKYYKLIKASLLMLVPETRLMKLQVLCLPLRTPT
jgi:hypothetical protein